MLKEAIEKILSLRPDPVVVIEERNYSTLNLSPVLDPDPETLTINTLSGIVDYLQENIDELEKQTLMLHVESHAQVSLISSVYGLFKQRDTYLKAKSESLFGNDFRFGNWFDLETFIIFLQSHFVNNPSRNEILSVLGNIKEEAVYTHADNGVTQAVTAKAGIALVKELPVPNPVLLKPYRTFREIDQPESAFVLRLKGKQGSKPECALFESDGGAWKLTAIQGIKDYLKLKLNGGRPDDIAVIG